VHVLGVAKKKIQRQNFSKKKQRALSSPRSAFGLLLLSPRLAPAIFSLSNELALTFLKARSPE
jgi:hypothetical protein